ncbi:hypothetical protein PQQ51_09780 [Paraburkholderia xenovorans]|uniref:glucosamine inositolphosphorylceramide transferase family protein n=1 Tax=Paraburkholderia xenovorans TaxID=36873 RepID=UPI0038BA9D0F
MHFPRMLETWMRIEQRLSKRIYDTLPQAPAVGEDLLVLFNGNSGIHSLYKVLLALETPHIQIVWISPHDGQARLLCESHVAVPERYFFCASLRLCMGRYETLLARARERKHDLDQCSPIVLPRIQQPAVQVFSAEIVRFAVRHLSYRLFRKISALFVRREHWALAAMSSNDYTASRQSDDTSRDETETPWRKLGGRPDRFYADPFLWLDQSGRYHLFFEDFPYDEGRGVISHVQIDASTRRMIGEPRVVLKRPYHLSYPYVFEYEGEVFMIPETSENRTVEVYRANAFPSGWELHRILLTDVIAADTTLHVEDGNWWMWTSLARDGEPNYDELSVYYADSPFGPWTPHPMNPVISDCRCARMAGKVFRDRNNRLVRPAQDCEKDYGASLRFCEITELTRTTYREHVIFSWTAPRAYDGVHTWNAAGDLAIVDVKSRLWHWPGRSVPFPRMEELENEDRDFMLRPTWPGRDGDSDQRRTEGDGPARA